MLLDTLNLFYYDDFVFASWSLATFSCQTFLLLLSSLNPREQINIIVYAVFLVFFCGEFEICALSVSRVDQWNKVVSRNDSGCFQKLNWCLQEVSIMFLENLNCVSGMFNPIPHGGADLPPPFAKSRIPKTFALLTHIDIHWLFMYGHYGPFTKNHSILLASV